ncbi:MAG TPA: hypothetical protein VN933_16820 [Candidatus Eremiobacteraceae bacterium]|nr:hypothetical protein [Candidatus Eremiobacteraceae bacterium]
MRQFHARILLSASVLALAALTRAAVVRADDSGLLTKVFEFAFSDAKATVVSDPAQTHEFKKAVKVRSTDGSCGVQTFCVDKQGRILALVGRPRYFDGSKESDFCEVHVLTPLGEPVSVWKLDLLGQSINAGADGTVYVAGNGSICKLATDGKVLSRLELPHIAEFLKNKDRVRKAAEEESREQAQSFEAIRKQFKERIKKLEDKPEDKLTRAEKRNLQQYRRSIEMFDRDSQRPNVDAAVQSIMTRMRIINSVAVSDRDVFIVCGETTGYGYSLWRLDHNFQNATQIMKGMRGCCGQMDVQIQANDVLVAENCEHAFARYDRDGKRLGQWGKMSRAGDVKCFGGCCNPMNVRCAANGDVLTAESEGFVKRFNSKGEFVALIGKQPLSGGCKNVAVAPSPDGKLVYMCDQPGSQIVIFAEKAKSVAQAKSARN